MESEGGRNARPFQIDYSGIPKLGDNQLAQFRRPPKKLVAVRLDADVSNGFSDLVPAIPRASTMFFEW